jgi:hypothetical protein
MEWQRIVELYDSHSGSFGTGYLLASGLVLTARHVVEGLSTTGARLFEPDEDGLPGAIGPRLEARVAWDGGPGLDLALLTSAKGGASFRQGIVPVVVAQLAGRAAVRVDAVGFPGAMSFPTHADTLHVEASVSAWTGLRGSSLLLEVHTARPKDAEAWQGMSGAAVFAGDRIIGVMEAVPGQFAEGALRATRADLMFNQQDAATLLNEGDVTLSDPIDAAYVEALPRAGHWSGVREQYARAVVTNLCRIDYVGIGLAGMPDRRMPAMAAFTAQRFATWP